MNALLLCLGLFISAAPADKQISWDQDPIWHDGLVEKATYDASRVVYGHPRSYEATFLTNKEQHETSTWTKATDDSKDTVEVWKHNQIEVIPTPNYDYKYTTTSHLTTDGLKLTRMDMSESEWCGTTYAQFLRTGDAVYDYFRFCYLPGTGRQTGTVEGNVVPINALPLYLRNFDFDAAGTESVMLLPDQKINKLTPFKPVKGEIKFIGEQDGGYKLEVYAGGDLFGTYVMGDRDTLHVMQSFESADGSQTYKLKSQERVNYWTIKGE